MPLPHILFVDDDPTILKLISQAFRKRGMEVTEAKNGLEAWGLLKAQPQAFDLVITDYQMPEMNGRELLSLLKTMAPCLPVILCSGTAQEEIGEKRGDSFLRKPYRFEKLEQMALQLLKNHRVGTNGYSSINPNGISREH